MSKGIRISEAAYLELRRRAESEKRTLQAVVDLLLEQTSAASREAASRELKAWLATTRTALPQEFITGMTWVSKPDAERLAADAATAAKLEMAASSEHGAPAAGRTDTSAAGCASTGVPPEGEPRSGGGEAAGTPGSSTTAAPPMVTSTSLCLCGHQRAAHGDAADAPCSACECQSFLDLEQDLF